MVTSFGRLGGLGGAHAPNRIAAPNSAAVNTDDELNFLHSNWVEQQRAAQMANAGTDINRLAANRAYADFTRSYGGEIPFGIGLTPTDAAPNTQTGAMLGLQPIQSLDPWQQSARGGDTFAAPSGQNFNLSNWIDPHRQGISQGIAEENARIDANIAARQAEHDAMMAGRVENQLRQQQAYDWMQGGDQQNALMSPDYATAGFNTITGMSNPNAGPGQIDGIGMDWAQGVYDPTTQQGTGTYQPGWQRNAGFGW